MGSQSQDTTEATDRAGVHALVPCPWATSRRVHHLTRPTLGGKGGLLGPDLIPAGVWRCLSHPLWSLRECRVHSGFLTALTFSFFFLLFFFLNQIRSCREAAGICCPLVAAGGVRPILPARLLGGLPRWLNSQESACTAGSIPGLGRSLGGGYGNALHYSSLEKSMDRGAWGATVHAESKSQTQFRD